MVKFSGFVLSSILVVLCLWLSVFSFPDVLQTSESALVEEARVMERSARSEAENGEAFEVPSKFPELAEELELERADTDDLRTESSVRSPSFGWKASEPTLAVASQSAPAVSEDALKPSERTRGGKYVSIPYAQTDAFRGRPGSTRTDRVVPTTRAVAPIIDTEYK